MSHPAAIEWADPAREALFQRWIAATANAHPLATDSLRPASADASFRRYFRVDARADVPVNAQTPAGAASFIIMDAPPDREDCTPFVKVAGLMRDAGLRVPEVLAWDQTNGFMLLSDLGGRTLLEVIRPDAPESNLPLYRGAIDTLVAWQRASQAGVLPPYDDALLRRELQLFPDWYLGRHRQDAWSRLQAAHAPALQASFDLIVQRVLAAPQVYVHRDFMPRNLMAGADAASPPGVLDFQDAVHGPITYDIASLMRDAFLSWDEEFVLDVTVRYWQAARKAGLISNGPWGDWGDDFGQFYRAVEWMGLQRHLKVLGIFARLTLRDGKPRYLADTPRFIAYVRHTAGRYRELGPLLRLVDAVEDTQTVAAYSFGRAA